MTTKQSHRMNKISKGCEVETVQPFFIEQTNENKLNVQCCNYCSKYICSHNKWSTNENSVSCKFGCKDVYCSEQCKEGDIYDNGHWLHCTGKSTGRHTRLTSEFVSHSKLHNSFYLTAFKVVSKIIAISLINVQCPELFGTQLRLAVQSFTTTFPVESLNCAQPVLVDERCVGRISGVDTLSEDDENEDLNNDDSLSDSYFMLLALLRYERRPPLIVSSRISLSDEDFSFSVCEVFTLSVYRAIVFAVTTHSVAVRLESPQHPLLAKVKNIPLLQYSDRLTAVKGLQDEADRANDFLTPNRGTVEVPADLRVEQQLDHQCASRDLINTERLAARLSQAADLAGNASSEVDCNPFGGLCFVGLALVPLAVWSGANHAHNVGNVDKDTRRLNHSCVPNVHLEAISTSSTTDNPSGVWIRAIALRDIHPHEELTLCYIDTSSATTFKERQVALNKKRSEVGCATGTEYVCDCERCRNEGGRPNDVVKSVLSSYLRCRGISRLSDLVDEYLSHDISTASPSLQSLLPSSVAQCLLLEVLNLSDVMAESGGHQHPNETLFKELVTARALADMYMQEGNLCDSLSLYCAVVLAFSTVGDLSESELSRMVGEVILSIGNALLDVSLSIAIQRSNGVISITSNQTGSYGDSQRVELTDPRSASIAAMLTAAPWQLCHQVWRVGNKLLGGKHSALSESCAKLDNYAYRSGDDGFISPEFLFNPQEYFAISVPTYPPASNSRAVKTPSLPFNSVDNTLASIYLSKQPILSDAECQQAINLAEHHAAQSSAGWTTARHYAVPTTDIPIHASPTLLAWFNDIMRDRLGARLRGQFVGPSVSADEDVEQVVVVHDAFIVKYQCDDEDSSNISTTNSTKQRYLPLHSDQSTHSLTVALNDRGEYEGGGTYFAALDVALRPNKGHVLSFRGELLHGGDPIISGTRYILAIFLLLQTDKPEMVRTSDTRDNKKRKGDECSGGLASLFRDRTAAALNGGALIDTPTAVQNEVQQQDGMFSFFGDETKTQVDLSNADSTFSFGFGFEA